MYVALGHVWTIRGGRADGKRIVDVCLTLAAAPLIFPMIGMLALFVWLQDGHGPFHRQERVGRNGERFRIWKLRSMSPDAERRLAVLLRQDPALARQWRDARKLRHDPRVTSVGRVLRRYSLDELPQVINILRGEMSLVGPRPVTAEELCSHYGESGTRAYYRVRPGVTGLWQVMGRNERTYADRVSLDKLYVEGRSPWLDMCILRRTVLVVLRGNGC